MGSKLCFNKLCPNFGWVQPIWMLIVHRPKVRSLFLLYSNEMKRQDEETLSSWKVHKREILFMERNFRTDRTVKFWEKRDILFGCWSIIFRLPDFFLKISENDNCSSIITLNANKTPEKVHNFSTVDPENKILFNYGKCLSSLIFVFWAFIYITILWLILENLWET